MILSLTGFGDLELKDLLAERTEGLTDPDDAPAVPEHPVSQTGDLWLLGRHRLLCGDSTVATDVGRVLGGVAPHLMVTDPPYGVNYDAGWRNAAPIQRRQAAGAPGVIGGSRALGKVAACDPGAFAPYLRRRDDRRCVAENQRCDSLRRLHRHRLRRELASNLTPPDSALSDWNNDEIGESRRIRSASYRDRLFSLKTPHRPSYLGTFRQGSKLGADSHIRGSKCAENADLARLVLESWSHNSKA